MDINFNLFGENLKKLRKRDKLSQVDLAEKLNLGSTTISNYEKGVSTPEFHTLIKIAKLFDVSIDALLFSNKMDFSTFPGSENENAHLKSTPNSAPISKLEKLGVQNQVQDSGFQYQSLEASSNREIEALKGENLALKNVIQMLETTIRAYESAIKAQETTIQTLKDAKFSKLSMLEVAQP